MNPNLPDYLQPEHQKKVFDVAHRVMQAHLNCQNKEADCLECGNADCFAAFEAQAKLWGMTLHELMKDWKKQREQDEEAAEIQKLRYEDYPVKRVIRKLKKKEGGLFNEKNAA